MLYYPWTSALNSKSNINATKSLAIKSVILSVTFDRDTPNWSGAAILIPCVVEIYYQVLWHLTFILLSSRVTLMSRGSRVSPFLPSCFWQYILAIMDSISFSIAGEPWIWRLWRYSVVGLLAWAGSPLLPGAGNLSWIRPGTTSFCESITF